MPRGGARNRSGPPADPNSGRSERRGYKLTALPARHDGPVPDFPLPRRDVFRKEWDESGKQVQVFDASETDRVERREADLWEWLWSLPQACAWSMPSERWRLMTVALYARTFVVCESGDATAADKGSLHRFADQIGMTDAGLAQMGWQVARDEVSAKAAETDEAAEAPRSSSRSRMKVVKADGA